MRNTYHITLQAPLGLRCGSLSLLDAESGSPRVLFSLFGIQSELAARYCGDGVRFDGELRFITGTRPCAGEFRIVGDALEGKLTLKGFTIPLTGALDGERKENAV
ncbi:MAG: hypothetical protein IJL26_11980 [Clostridia bacterium]|nr:hypothetical protein [Clostridia bacterium]